MINTELTLGLITFYFIMFVTPGPNNIMLTASGIRFGFKKTIPHLLGIPLGHTIQISLVTLGLGVIFKNYPFTQIILKFLGCGYLFFLAYTMFGSLNIKNVNKVGRPLKFYEASLFQFLNPKAWLVATTAVTVFFPENVNFITGLLFITFFAPIVCLPSITVWAVFGSTIKKFISNNKIKKIIEIVLAFLLIVTGIIMIL